MLCAHVLKYSHAHMQCDGRDCLLEDPRLRCRASGGCPDYSTISQSSDVRHVDYRETTTVLCASAPSNHKADVPSCPPEAPKDKQLSAMDGGSSCLCLDRYQIDTQRPGREVHRLGFVLSAPMRSKPATYIVNTHVTVRPPREICQSNARRTREVFTASTASSRSLPVSPSPSPRRSKDFSKICSLLARHILRSGYAMRTESSGLGDSRPERLFRKA